MGAESHLPETGGLEALRSAARECRGCPLYRRANQTVFGSGDSAAWLMLVGEQPGDAEDKAGEPFVGPAGKLLDRALGEAGIDRGGTYVTNMVKHFKYTRSERGKRRIHERPNRAELTACRPWLSAELAAVRPRVLLALGATAAKSLLGRDFRVTIDAGVPFDAAYHGLAGVDTVLATVHPSAIVRIGEGAERTRRYRGFVADLRTAANLESTPSRPRRLQ
ncbi:UdgX family uracil-DNA binding protein [Sciscionella sediminilitoris]|uniref:UdgX family uracil-DNA binding protein n=1 Tax=Sciscionella sediminilitoris TaxID=1445613 RepID=UPI0004DFBCAF|nr:UdgX family uracil-DNA binding protein [Sciscionella sp. SE31]